MPPRRVPVAFNSIQYAVLLAAVFLGYRRAGKTLQNVILLIASYLFYGAWDWRFLSLLWVSTLVDFVVGRQLGRSDDPTIRRRWLLVSLAVNLGLLGFFKYFGFFVESAATMLESLGLQADLPFLRIVLPVGISFYTFQTLSYTIDVYRNNIEPTRDLLGFGVYVAFFPQLVAGPIERASHLLPQFTVRRPPASNDQLRSGVHLIALGLFRKVVIADTVAPFANAAFSDAATAGWITLTVGLLAFSLQIYGDFAGYSDIARGSARVLGIELMENFNQPYLARNISHFWRTWHISLSSWLRDYLYIPLGGNRSSRAATMRNLAITMLLGGLWHGAAWTFVVWGGLHGLYLAAHRSMRHRTSGGELAAPTLWDVPFIMATFGLVAFTWIFFRAEDFAQAADYVAGIGTLRAGAVDATAIWIVLPAVIVSLLIDMSQRRARTHEAILAWRPPIRGLAYGMAAVAFLVFSGTQPVPFIYFQF